MVAITAGAHWRNPDAKQGTEYAHLFDPESPEDVAHQAQNFILYAQALGSVVEPLVLVRPNDDELPSWVAPLEPHSARHFDPSDAHVEIMLAECAQVIEGATGMKVEIR
jgi:hypothetical protein